MADIFVSYAREDRDRANALTQALAGTGFSVWIDSRIPTAHRWEELLVSELEMARCIVMLWSSHALASEFVRKEGKAGFERAALVPVLISKSDIPDEFASIQFADLTGWNGDADAPAFLDLVVAIRTRMLPRCQISFASLLQPRPDSADLLYKAYIDIAARLGLVSAPGRFERPKSPAEEQRLHRAIASLQVSVDWDGRLSSLYENSPRRKAFVDRATQIERRIPLIWLGLRSYSGPFYDLGTHANFLRFASLMFFHEMFLAARSAAQPIEVPSPLTKTQLSFPRWEGAISVFFEDQDETEIAAAYVTHIDRSPLPREEVFYGPKGRTQIAYGKSINRQQFTEPLLLERYVIPQRELRCAIEGSRECTPYRGNLTIRKITDLAGNDLEPEF